MGAWERAAAESSQPGARLRRTTEGLLSPRRWLPRRGFVLALAALYLVWFTALNVGGAVLSDRSADCLLVPGARVLPDGQPGPSLKGRLDAASTYFRQGRARKVICTGGRGDSGHLEAEAARDYLVAQGVPRQAILLEDMSHTTWENFVFARDQMRRNGWTSCLVVTDPFHMQRCLLMARELGLQPLSAPSFSGPGWRKPASMLFYTTRELAAWAKYFGERWGRAWGDDGRSAGSLAVR